MSPTGKGRGVNLLPGLECHTDAGIPTNTAPGLRSSWWLGSVNDPSNQGLGVPGGVPEVGWTCWDPLLGSRPGIPSWDPLLGSTGTLQLGSLNHPLKGVLLSCPHLQQVLQWPLLVAMVPVGTRIWWASLVQQRLHSSDVTRLVSSWLHQFVLPVWALTGSELTDPHRSGSPPGSWLFLLESRRARMAARACARVQEERLLPRSGGSLSHNNLSPVSPQGFKVT